MRHPIDHETFALNDAVAKQDLRERVPWRHPLLVAGAIVLVTVGPGAATKVLAEKVLKRYRPVEIIDEWLRLGLGYNEGVAFGLFAMDGYGVIIVSSIALAVLATRAVLMLRNAAVPSETAVALGLVLGGGIANLVDRFPDGRVTDFIDVGLGLHRWPTFKLADVFILTGVGLLLFSAYRQEREAMTDECRPPAP